jgi:hypothetical protein
MFRGVVHWQTSTFTVQVTGWSNGFPDFECLVYCVEYCVEARAYCNVVERRRCKINSAGTSNQSQQGAFAPEEI